MTSWANCPFCSRVFEIDSFTPTITIDRRRRYVCGECAVLKKSTTHGNGEARNDKDNGGPSPG